MLSFTTMIDKFQTKWDETMMKLCSCWCLRKENNWL
ncbi:hypothetical protein BVRB_1g021110 [Beta vulgaris subsp. vulgaris]|nr:hypothetical protein BVRB_1g021110 [Beta vulgaris subsp. vulgaris]